MKISRKEAQNLKAGDVVHYNVTDKKNLTHRWYEVKSTRQEGRDVFLTVQLVHVNLPTGLVTKQDQVHEEKMLNRTVLIKMV